MQAGGCEFKSRRLHQAVVAQWLVRGVANAEMPSSILADRSTSYVETDSSVAERAAHNGLVVGSIPTPSTIDNLTDDALS